jgi:uncharacterized damage-inducible protein DinB
MWMTETQTFENPDFPYGEYQVEGNLSAARRREWLQLLRELPDQLESAVADLTPAQLATCYRRWTITQIVHHLADAQLNWFLRFKQAMTLLRPTIMPFDEDVWTELADAHSADIRPSLQIIRGINARWYELCQYMPDEDFARVMHHPQRPQDVSLDQALALSTWHTYHHLSQIQWLRKNRLVIESVETAV